MTTRDDDFKGEWSAISAQDAFPDAGMLPADRLMTEATDQRLGGLSGNVDIARQLAAIMKTWRLTNIELQVGARKISLVCDQVASATAGVSSNTAASATFLVTPESGGASPPIPPTTIRSAVVGTAYLADQVGGEPLAAVGKQVAIGDTLLVIHMMRVRNQVISPLSGTVTAVLVNHGQPVEFDQPLIVVGGR